MGSQISVRCYRGKCLCVVSREEWDWIQTLSAAGQKDHARGGSEEAGPRAESHAPLLYYELQTAIKSLLNHINLPLHQVPAALPDLLSQFNETSTGSAQSRFLLETETAISERPVYSVQLVLHQNPEPDMYFSRPGDKNMLTQSKDDVSACPHKWT